MWPWAQVFGQVVSGYSVVRAAEACGSRSGETSHDVIIGDAGVLPPAASSASSAGAQPLHNCLFGCKLFGWMQAILEGQSPH